MLLSRSLRHRAVAATVAALVAGGLAAGQAGPARASSSPLAVVGHTDPTPDLATSTAGGAVANGMLGYAQSSLLMDPGQRRAYQLAGFTNSTQSKVYSEIDVIDLDSLHVIRRAVIPDYLATPSTPTLGQWTYLTALKTGSQPRLFFVADALGKGNAQPFDLITVDLTTMSVVADVAIQQPSNQCAYGGNPVPQTCPIYGITFDQRSGLVYLLTASASMQAFGTLYHYTLTAVSYDPSAKAVLDRIQFPAVCDGPPSSNPGSGNENIDQAPIFRSTDGSTLWTACETQSSEGQQSSEVAPVSVPVAADGRLLSQCAGSATTNCSPNPVNVYPAFTGLTDGYADPESDRMYFRAITFGGDKSLVVFDGRHQAYVGVASLDKGRYLASGTPQTVPSYGNGVDPSTGRFYHFTLDSIYVVDGRRTAREGFPQAAVFPADGPGRYGTRAVAVDPVAHHVFVMYGNDPYDGAKNDKLDDFYTVYKDTYPVSQDTQLGSLDANTADIPLGPGTTAIYNAHAQGFGARSFTVNPSDLSFSGETADLQNAGGQHDIYEALVGNTRGNGTGTDLSSNSAQALSYAVGEDQRTLGVYQNVTGNVPGSAAPQYPYGEIVCGDVQGSKDSHSSADPGGYTTATCDLNNHEAKVTSLVGGGAVGPSQNQPALPDIASAEITTDVRMETVSTSTGSVEAAVSEATAIVRGIQLAAGVTIDAFTIHARSVAGGRSGTASSTVTRTFTGVTTPGFSCSSQCDTQATLKSINAALQAQFPGQFQVELPDADQAAAAGTPHGYYAAVYKDNYEFLNDALTNQDQRPEVVGLELVRNNTALFGGEQAYQVFDFGGVEVESRFGITPTDALFNDTSGTGTPTGTTGSPATDGPVGTIGPSGPSGDIGGSTPPGQAGGGGGGLFNRIIQSILKGLGAFTDIHQLPLMATVWTLFMLPGYLATRRRRLERFGL